MSIKPATDEEIAKLPKALQCADCGCRNPEACDVFTRRLIARIEADREELSKLRQAIGLLSTLHPTMVMDPDDPITMAHAIHAHVEAEIRNLKAELAVAQSFHDVAVKERNLAYAEVERLTPSCAACKGQRTTTPTGNIPCSACGGTGRAR